MCERLSNLHRVFQCMSTGMGSCSVALILTVLSLGSWITILEKLAGIRQSYSLRFLYVDSLWSYHCDNKFCKYFQFSKFLKNYAWHTKKRVSINWSGLIFMNEATNMGKVENTDPRSADYPLTPTPRTTIRTTPRTTLQTTLNNQPSLLLRRKEIQQTYLRYLHDRSTRW